MAGLARGAASVRVPGRRGHPGASGIVLRVCPTPPEACGGSRSRICRKACGVRVVLWSASLPDRSPRSSARSRRALPRPATSSTLAAGPESGGAAWALGAGGSPQLLGIDRHPWAVDESRRTYRELGLRGHARTGDLKRLPPLASSGAVIAAYTLNELSNERRGEVEMHLLEAATQGTRVLIVEPISRA